MLWLLPLRWNHKWRRCLPSLLLTAGLGDIRSVCLLSVWTPEWFVFFVCLLIFTSCFFGEFSYWSFSKFSASFLNVTGAASWLTGMLWNKECLHCWMLSYRNLPKLGPESSLWPTAATHATENRAGGGEVDVDSSGGDIIIIFFIIAFFLCLLQ